MVGNTAEVVKRLLTETMPIRTLLSASLLISIAPVTVHTHPRGLSRTPSITNSPPPHYHVVHGWPVLPENTILDEVSAVAVDSHDDVLVLQRGGRKWPDSGHPTLRLFQSLLCSFSMGARAAAKEMGREDSGLTAQHHCRLKRQRLDC